MERAQGMPEIGEVLGSGICAAFSGRAGPTADTYEEQLERKECFRGSRHARMGLRSRTTGALRQEPLDFKLEFSQVAQANAVGNGPQTGATLHRFAPGANRYRPRKLTLTTAHLRSFNCYYIVMRHREQLSNQEVSWNISALQ